MIGQLRGEVASIGEDTAIIDVGGVGYEISATPRLLSGFTQGSQVTLAVETLVAETYIRLVGFDAESERQTFRLLQTVQGVGAKAALAILHVLTPSEVLDAIAAQDKTIITRAQGVGPKLAQRLVSELKGKTGGIFGAQDFRAPDGANSSASIPMDDARRDAVSALMNLGYDENKARLFVGGISTSDDETVESLITAVLKGLSPS